MIQGSWRVTVQIQMAYIYNPQNFGNFFLVLFHILKIITTIVNSPQIFSYVSIPILIRGIHNLRFFIELFLTFRGSQMCMAVLHYWILLPHLFRISHFFKTVHEHSEFNLINITLVTTTFFLIHRDRMY